MDTLNLNNLKKVDHSLSSIHFAPFEIKQVLKHLKPSLSEPYDGIPQVVYKECADVLCVPLAHIFNISMILGEVPQLWKEALVTAIPKCSPATSVSDYRPISITPTAAKVMEKVIRNKLQNWLIKFNLIPKEQHGLLSGASSSSATNLTDTFHDWTRALNNGSCIDTIFIDLFKAFDKVCHEKLLVRLKLPGLSGKLLDWFRSYLYNRHFMVKLGRSFDRYQNLWNV